jgi:sodium-independent sulfate anion transporter 11
VPIVPIETPFFHFDLTSAVRAAEAGLEKPGERAETPPVKYL